jgi:1-acyl-sn-glycerol-3-phosphate acyltransferase
MLVFVVLAIICFPFLVVAVFTGNSKIIKAAHYLPAYGARIALFLWGVKIEIRNKELIDAKGQYIYISNHRSYLDAFIAANVIPNFLKYLGKAEMLQWPMIGYLLKNYYVPVWRKDKDNRAWSMQEMEEKVKTGCSFFICPEGTCNISEDFFIRFYHGAFKLSLETGIPIVPLTFIGAGERMPRSKFLLTPGSIVVYWHPPIFPSEFSMDTTDEVRERVLAIMRKDLLVHYPEGKYKL